jgi:hypothetical protein
LIARLGACHFAGLRASPVSPGLAGCQVKAALFKRIGRPGIAGPKACAGRTEPSNNASPHHGAEKLSIARADYLLAERVTIAANGNQGQECGYGTIRTRACLPLDDRGRPGLGRKAAKLRHVANACGRGAV